MAGDPGAITMAPNGKTAWVTLTNNGANTALVPLNTARLHGRQPDSAQR